MISQTCDSSGKFYPLGQVITGLICVVSNCGEGVLTVTSESYFELKFRIWAGQTSTFKWPDINARCDGTTGQICSKDSFSIELLKDTIPCAGTTGDLIARPIIRICHVSKDNCPAVFGPVRVRFHTTIRKKILRIVKWTWLKITYSAVAL